MKDVSISQNAVSGRILKYFDGMVEAEDIQCTEFLDDLNV